VVRFQGKSYPIALRRHQNLIGVPIWNPLSLLPGIDGGHRALDRPRQLGRTSKCAKNCVNYVCGPIDHGRNFTKYVKHCQRGSFTQIVKLTNCVDDRALDPMHTPRP